MIPARRRGWRAQARASSRCKSRRLPDCETRSHGRISGTRSAPTRQEDSMRARSARLRCSACRAATVPLAVASQRGGAEPTYFDVPRGRASARCRRGARARRRRLLHGAEDAASSASSIPKTGKVEEIPLGPEFGAARRHRRTRRRGVDHRRRPECDRARRPEDARRARLAARQGRRVRQSQHAHVRREGPRLVYRPERLLRPPRSRRPTT